MKEFITSALMLTGAAFILLGAIGITRMPDLYTRTQPATKAATLGVGCMMLAVAVHFGKVGITARALAGILFFILTAPIAAHMIGRAAYMLGVPLWEDTEIDELQGRYNLETRYLSSGAEDEGPEAEAEAETETEPQSTA